MENQIPRSSTSWDGSQAYNNYITGTDVEYIEVEQPIRALTVVPPRTQLTPRNNFGLLILLAVVLGGGFVLRNMFARSAQPSSNIRNTPAIVANVPSADGLLSLPATVVSPDGVQVLLPMPPTATPPSAPQTLVASDSAAASSIPANEPIWSHNYAADDGLPIFICGGNNSAAFLTLAQMQASGKDVAHGFHLGLVPYDLPGKAGLTTRDTAESALRDGQWDCELTSLDRVAQAGHAVVTALTDASAGAHGIWARNIATVEALRGRRITYVRRSAAEYFLLVVLKSKQLDPGKDVTLLPVDTIGQAAALFIENNADAVVGWLPGLNSVVAHAGQPVITTEQLRAVVDVVAVSRHAIETRPAVVQAFHDAWFDTLKMQLDAPWESARAIAMWGNGDWTGVHPERALTDLRTILHRSAQANLIANTQVMSRPAALLGQIQVAQQVWLDHGSALPLGSADTLIDPRFVLRTSQQVGLRSVTPPLNTAFVLPTVAPAQNTAIVPTPGGLTLSVGQSAAVELSTTVPSVASGVLPCKRFSFLPDSAILTQESRAMLDTCVLPALRQRNTTRLRVVGSAAWPGPKGTYSEGQILELARARAQAVADYLASQQVDPQRFIVDAVVPPIERREVDDIVLQNLDRYVEMTILATPS